MIASTVWNNLKDTLNNNPTLSGYIKFVFEGRREDIEPESLPCLMLEPTQDLEIIKEYNQVKDVQLSVDIFGFSSNNFHEFPKTIVGDANYKGVLDIANDVRACLQASYSLGGTVIDIKFDPTLFDLIDVEKYPVRGFVMPVKIHYRQTNNE